MQTMWSNALNSEFIKFIVDLGKMLINVIDKLGLFNSLLITAATIYMVKNKVGPIVFLGQISNLIRDVVKKIPLLIGSLSGATAAQSAYTAETLSASVANGTLTASEAAAIATKNQLTMSTTALNAAEAAELLTKSGIPKADALAIVSSLGLSKTTDILTAATVRAAMADAGYTAKEIERAVAALFGASANMTLAESFKALWDAIWPVLVVMLAFAGISFVVKNFDKWTRSTKYLREEFDELKTELQEIQSEMDTVNSELETMEERMAELLAKDSLTFTEEEELKRLQKENAELQRKLDLLEREEQLKQEGAARTFNEMMARANSDDYYVTGEKKEWYNYVIDTVAEAITPGSAGATTNLKNVLNSKIKAYENYATQLAEIEAKMANTDNKDEYDNLKKEKQRIDDEMREVRTYLDDKTREMGADAEGLEYFTGDNLEDWQIEANKNLDKIKNFEDKWSILRGDSDAQSNAITRIFNKDEYAEASDIIDDLVKQLAKDPTNQTVLNKISEQCKLAEEDLLAVGLSAEKAADYFAKLGSDANYDTLDGKIEEISKAATNFEVLVKGFTFQVDGIDIGLSDLFDEEGKIIQTKLSQVFQDTSDQTREDITRLLEGSYDQIKNGTVDVERLLSGFALKTTQQVLEIQNKVLGEQNLELFPNLKDEIDGIIDKFSEFSTAVGSVVDALDTLEQARAEEAYSGSISIETLENLMKYTDDYTQLVEIDETGAIRLAADAEQILIEQRLQKIKADAAAAVQTAQTNLEQAKYNAKAVNETGPVQAALTSATDALAGSWAYLGSIIGDITSGNFSGIFERASAAYSNVTAGREEKRAQVNVSVEDAEKALENALNQQKIANALTSDNVKSKYSSDEASGGNETKEDVEEDRFKRAMDYWENRIGANQARYEQLQNEIDLLESKGQKADASYYEEQIKLENERLSLLEQQKAEAQSFLGTFTEGSEEWFRKKPA